MRAYSSAITNYRAARKAFWPLHFVSFQVKAIGDPDTLTWCHFCTAEDNVAVSVVDPDTGLTDARTFAGGGHIVGMGDLVRSEKEIIRSHTLVLSGASSTVLDMVNGFNCRGALFQWFIGELDQDTGLLLDTPPCEFVGFVDTIDLVEGAVDPETGKAADSTFDVTVDSLGAALVARNFEMRSLDASKGRSGDLFNKYADSVHHWEPRWGKDKKSERHKHGGKSGKGGGGKSGSTDGTGRARPDRT